MIDHTEMQAVFDECASFVPGTTVAFASVGRDSIRCGVAGAPVTDASLFQIGSVTKLVTATLYALVVRDGSVTPETTLGAIWHSELPNAAVRDITLGELARHASGLPRLPQNLDARRDDCYADYSMKNMLEYLSAVSPGQIADGRGVVEYSNLGYAVLGQSIAAVLRSTYRDAVVGRVLMPLGMCATTFADRRAASRSACMPGFTADGEIVDAWAFGALAPAGAIVSTCADMARFVQAVLGGGGPVGEALRSLAGDPTASGEPVGWSAHGPDVRWHNGQTAGFHAMVAVDLANDAGIVALRNVACDLDDLCLYALGAIPAYRERPRVGAPDRTASKTFVGSYDGHLGAFTVSVGRAGLTLSGRSYGTCRLYSASRDRIFAKIVDVDYSVVCDRTGTVIGLNERYGCWPTRLAPKRPC